MDNIKLNTAEECINSIQPNKNVKVKVLKKENGLIERKSADETKIILTEDNRQVIFG